MMLTKEIVDKILVGDGLTNAEVEIVKEHLTALRDLLAPLERLYGTVIVSDLNRRIVELRSVEFWRNEAKRK